MPGSLVGSVSCKPPPRPASPSPHPTLAPPPPGPAFPATPWYLSGEEGRKTMEDRP